MKLLKSLLSAAAVACLVVAPLSAQAGPITLTLDDGTGLAGGFVTVVGSLVSDTVSFAGTFGSANQWTINNIIGVGPSAVPGAPFGIDLSSFNATSTSGGKLTISLSENNLNFGVAGPKLVGGRIGGTIDTGGTLQYSLYADTNNALFGSSVAGLAFTGSSSLPSFNQSGSAQINLANPFSMTIVTVLTHTQAGFTSYDFRGQIPEPATIALVGLALLGLGAATRRKA